MIVTKYSESLPALTCTERGLVMVDAVGEKYHCHICGNEVVVTNAGGGTLVCCGEEMERIEG